MITYPLTNLIARLNNEKTISLKKTNIILNLLDVLQSEGFLSYSFNPYSNIITINSNLINKIKAYSVPNRIIFMDSHSSLYLSNSKLYFILTNLGIMTHIKARSLGLNGFILVSISS